MVLDGTIAVLLMVSGFGGIHCSVVDGVGGIHCRVVDGEWSWRDPLQCC